MRLLLSLILSLTDEEAARLSALNLRGKQRAMMDIILAARANGTEPSQEAIAKLGISKTHLYEITSVLMDRCCQLFVPKGGKELLEFYAYKNLHLHFRQELRAQRKNLAETTGKTAEDFFLTGFELLIRFSSNLLDQDLLNEYSTLYLASKKSPALEDGYAIEIRKLYIRMVGMLAEGTIGKEQEEIAEQLREFEKLARNTSHSYFCFSLYNSIAWYWQNLGGKPDMSLRYIQRAIPFAEKLRGFVFREVPQEMQLRLADAHFILGDAEQALTIFERVYTYASPSSIVWKRNYYLFRYVTILIYNGKYAQAETILKKYFEPSFAAFLPTTASATAASLFALLYLFSENFPKAEKYLFIAKDLNTRQNFTLYNEVRNRYIEAAYYYLRRDFEQAQSSAHRAMQYLHSRGFGLTKHIFGYYFKIIEASIEFHAGKKKFSTKLENKYKELTKPQEELFGLLIKKIRTKEKH